MATLRIPSPLRPYAGGQHQIEVQSADVAGALQELVTAHPDLKKHLFNEQGELRQFVNLFLNDENVRDLQGLQTAVGAGDTLMILPSIAGGAGLGKVDHAALRTNQAFIIGLSLAAFVLNAPWLAGLVGLAMAAATALRVPAFGFAYQRLFKPLGWLKPEVLADNPEPHRFAQGFGAVVQLLGFGLLAAGSAAGWGLVWVVIFLAALNLFAGFCAGCAVYYWLNRAGAPGFVKAAPAGSFPGMRPKAN
jgi:molybdopterin converting factor small subunit